MMDESPSYFTVMCAKMASHIHGHVLEVGCGTGICTPSIARLPNVSHVTAIDVEEAALEEARRHFVLPSVTFERRDLHDLPAAAFDSIVCANVLEHIEDDTRALASLRSIVRPEGTLALLVPAHPLLMSRYDYEAGHFRRYTKASLRPLLVQAGYSVDRLFHFNAIGAVGWFVAFRLLQRRRVSEGQTRFLVRSFERFALPVSRALESVVAPPFGLSLIALCRPNPAAAVAASQRV